MTPLLSTLREPPVPGRFYMVPVVVDHGKSWPGAWPVLGPMHTDIDLFPHFPWPHYHVDFRFVTAAQERRLSSFWRTALEAVGSFPLSHRPEAKLPLPKGLPQLARRKCRRSSYGYAETLSDRDHVGELERQYGTRCKPIIRPDGRKLCPHRKVDLSSFPPRPDGTVVCPLHGLTVQVAEQA